MQIHRAQADDQTHDHCRTCVVAAHPDDETLGAASVLLTVADVAVVHLTEGAPRDRRFWSPDAPDSAADYARLRRREAESALARAGVPRERWIRLEGTDQEAALQMASLATRLADLFGELAPLTVITHAYEGGHPDHDATALTVHAATALLRRRDAPLVPRVWEMACYHGAPGRLIGGEFLDRDAGPGRMVVLSAEQRRRKQEMLDCYASQARVLAQFPVGVERFRVAPRYDFLSPPHPGALYYEQLGWPMTGAAFRGHAAQALAALNLAGASS